MSAGPADVVEEFRRVAREHRRCVWLDGGGAREWSGRRSILGWLEDDDVSLSFARARGEVTRHVGGRSEVVGDDIFTVLAAEIAPGEQWFGWLGHAARPDLPATASDGVPDAVWLRPSHVRLFDHPTRGLDTPPLAPRDGYSTIEAASVSKRAEIPAEYADAFARVQEHLHAGDSYEVNLTLRERARCADDPAEVYLRLRALNPAPYAGFLQHDIDGARGWLLSSSPERFALVDAERRLTTKPIKGTTPRGDTPESDEEARERLASDPKFRAENLMIVDLLRNDLSMVCEPGTVAVPELMAVESYASVHQLVSTISGRLRAGVTTLDALRAIFPAGSMTGAPKLRTMQIIEAVEATPRGAYAGAFGWISGDGPADLGVVIRALTTTGDGTWAFGTGGGITVDSEVAEEWAETRWKAQRLLAALGCDA